MNWRAREPVWVYGDRLLVGLLSRFANRYQRRYRFRPQDDADAPDTPGSVVVHLLSYQDERIVHASRETGVSVSTYRAEEISRYLNTTIETYLLFTTALGLAQHRVLTMNELIVPEDFLHTTDETCVYSPPRCFSDYILTLEDPHICPSCTHFYTCLGAETELLLARRVMPKLRAGECLTPPPE